MPCHITDMWVLQLTYNTRLIITYVILEIQTINTVSMQAVKQWFTEKGVRILGGGAEALRYKISV